MTDLRARFESADALPAPDLWRDKAGTVEKKLGMLKSGRTRYLTRICFRMRLLARLARPIVYEI